MRVVLMDRGGGRVEDGYGDEEWMGADGVYER